MDFEEVMKIFDSCWFVMEILKSLPRSSSISVFEENPDQENEEKLSKPEISRIQTRHKRSMSVDLMSSTSTTSIDSVSFSPDSVLFTPKLQTILSGKESTEGEHEHEHVSKKKAAARTRRRRRSSGGSKSLSDLEFEELKGFMDLGFVFTEEDNKDCRLVEIVPGLQRLGRKKSEDENMEESEVDDDDDDDDDDEESGIPRPYLSEAWDVLDMRKKEKTPLLMNLKIPALRNEIHMKDKLRWWAQTVASTVR